MAFLPKSLLNTVDSVSPIANLKRRDKVKGVIKEKVDDIVITIQTLPIYLSVIFVKINFVRINFSITSEAVK